MQGRSKNGLREQGEQSSLKLLCWFRDGSTMSIYTHGFTLSLAAKVSTWVVFFFNQLAQMWDKEAKGSVNLKSCQQITKWRHIQSFKLFLHFNK